VIRAVFPKTAKVEINVSPKKIILRPFCGMIFYKISISCWEKSIPTFSPWNRKAS
jgi:hypothetical protein